MRALIWTGSFLNRLPNISADEWGRHVLRIPNPFNIDEVIVDEENGVATTYYKTLVVVIGPWWACRYFRHDWYREHTLAARKDAQRWLDAEKQYRDSEEYGDAVCDIYEKLEKSES